MAFESPPPRRFSGDRQPLNMLGVCGLALSFCLPVISYSVTLSARITALETLAGAPSKDIVQISALQQSVIDLRADLAEWKVEQRAREQAAIAANVAARAPVPATH